MGPATENKCEELILNGMDAARFNFSHENHEIHGRRINEIKAAREKHNKPIPLIIDTKGPEIRIGVIKKNVVLTNGEKVSLVIEDIEGDSKAISISNKNLFQIIEVGQSIYIDDGRISLEAIGIEGTSIICKIQSGGSISSRKGVNIPGHKIDQPFVTEQDRQDIEFAIDQDFDYIALSFVQSARDIYTVREILKKKYRDDIKIIAKIENKVAVENIDEIIEAADSIMIARGDLGIELPIRTVPIIQKKLIRKCYSSAKPVIVATQMLESMTENPVPTRAEVSDIANAIYDGTSVVMLSGETAAGEYPVESLKMMVQVIEETEKDIDYKARFDEDVWKKLDNNVLNAISEVSVVTSFKVGAKAIIAPTRTGNSVRMISSFRPSCPIIAITMDQRIQRQLNISWGIQPLLNEFISNQKQLFEKVMERAVESSLVESGDLVVLTAGIPTGSEGKTNMLKLQKIGEPVIGE